LALDILGAQPQVAFERRFCWEGLEVFQIGIPSGLLASSGRFAFHDPELLQRRDLQGRSVGSRNKNTLLIEDLLDQNSESLLHKALNLAQQGNIPMLRLLLDCVSPRPKDAPVTTGPLPMRSPEELFAGAGERNGGSRFGSAHAKNKQSRFSL
jgi:hypothetical protein